MFYDVAAALAAPRAAESRAPEETVKVIAALRTCQRRERARTIAITARFREEVCRRTARSRSRLARRSVGDRTRARLSVVECVARACRRTLAVFRRGGR